MIDSSFADRDSACTMQLLVKAGGDSDSMARLTGFVSMLQQYVVSLERFKKTGKRLKQSIIVILMGFLYLYIQQKSSMPLGGPLFLQDSVLPFCSYRNCTVYGVPDLYAKSATIADVHYIYFRLYYRIQ